TTHDIGDIEDLCESIVVLDEGRKIYDGTLDELVNKFTSRRIILETEDAIELEIEGVEEIESINGKTKILFDSEKISASELMNKVLERYDVGDFQIKEPDIEMVVKKIYNEGI
ncbi:MAG: hypothetical protein BRC27_01415, partial [Nanohaloarchaea archaeon SW_10_44_10]